MSSLLDLGSGISIFPFDANWTQDLQTKVLQARTLYKTAGTIVTPLQQSLERPKQLEKGFVLEGAEIYQMIDFWNNRQGRYNKFWLYGEYTSFRVIQDISAGDLSIACAYNQFEKIYKGYERLYIKTVAGDYYTRKISSAVKTAGNLVLGMTATSTNITVSDVEIIGRILLVRFEEDSLKVKYISRDVAEVSVAFTELVQEYPS